MQEITTKDTQASKKKMLTNGFRIINVDKLQQYTNNLTAHASRCQGSILVHSETRQGLAGTLFCMQSHNYSREKAKGVYIPNGNVT